MCKYGGGALASALNIRYNISGQTRMIHMHVCASLKCRRLIDNTRPNFCVAVPRECRNIYEIACSAISRISRSGCRRQTGVTSKAVLDQQQVSPLECTRFCNVLVVLSLSIYTLRLKCSCQCRSIGFRLSNAPHLDKTQPAATNSWHGP